MTFKMVRARQTPPIVEASKSGVVARNRPGKRDVVLAVHDAFGGTTCSAGVGDGGRCQRIDGIRLAWSGRGCGQACTPFVAIGRRHADDREARSGAGLRLRVERGVGEHDARPRMGEKVAALELAEGRVQPDPSCSEAHHGEERDDDVSAVGARCRDRRSPANAFPSQHVTRLGDFMVQLGERERPVIPEEGRCVGATKHGAVEKLLHGCRFDGAPFQPRWCSASSCVSAVRKESWSQIGRSAVVRRAPGRERRERCGPSSRITCPCDRRRVVAEKVRDKGGNVFGRDVRTAFARAPSRSPPCSSGRWVRWRSP